jgi:hypothetical protein
MWFIPLVDDRQSIYLIDKIETRKKKSPTHETIACADFVSKLGSEA